VSSHVDGVAMIVAMVDDGASTRVTLQLPMIWDGLAIAPKEIRPERTLLTVNR
jgi:riboflavin synthase